MESSAWVQWGMSILVVGAVCLTTHTAKANAPKCSCSTEWVQTFRGNQTRSFYGTGYIPAKLNIKWRFRTRWIRDSRLKGYGGRKLIWRGTGWSGQAAVVGDRVWVSSVGGILYCLNRHTGKLIWKFRAGLSIKSSVTYWNNRVYFGSRSNRLYCLNATTGKKLWTFHTPGKNIDSTPIVWKGRLYWGAEDTHLYAMNPLNGKIHWKYKTMGSIESSPSIVGNRVYIDSYDGHLHCVDRKTGTLRWRFRTGDDTDTTPTFHRGKIYLGSENGEVYAVHAETGELLWKRQTNGGVWSTPTMAGRRLFVGSNDRRFYGFDAETGRLLWKYTTGDGVWASAVHVDGRVLFGDWAGFLHVLRSTDGERIDRIRLGVKYKADGNHIVSTASVVKGRVYIGSRDGHFYCFDGPRNQSTRGKRRSQWWRKRFGQERASIVTKLSSLTPTTLQADTLKTHISSAPIRTKLANIVSGSSVYGRLTVARLLATNRLKTELGVALLGALMKDGASHVRLAAVTSAMKYGKKAAAAAESLLNDPDGRVRAAACLLQGRWGRKALASTIEKHLLDRQAMVQVACATALYYMGQTRKARGALRRFLFGGGRRLSAPRGCPTRVSKYYAYRNQAGKIRRVPRQKRPVLHALMALHKMTDRCAEKHIFSRWHGCDRGREKGYCSIFNDWQGWVKRLAPITVIPLMPKRKQLRALRRYGLPRYKDKNLRANGYQHLSRLDTPKRIPLLMKGLQREKYAMLRIESARGLVRSVASHAATQQALRKALAKDKNPDVRIAVVNTMVKGWKNNAIAILKAQLAKESSVRVKAAIATGLAKLGDNAGHGVLRSSLQAASRDARCRALGGLVTFSEGVEKVKAVLNGTDRFLRLCAIKALLSIDQKGAVTPLSTSERKRMYGHLSQHKDPIVAARALLAWLR